MLLLLDLLPCGGAACVWPASKAGGSPALAALASSLGTAPAPDVPTAPLSHPLECALHHEHCSLLITAAPLLGAALALVAILRAGPPLTAPAWAVPPLLPPP